MLARPDVASLPPSLSMQNVIPLRDAEGRQLILNGLNSGSGKDTYMRRFWEQPDDLKYEAVDLGYNAFRYLIFWDHVMPAPGVIDQAYLDDVASRVQWLADQGMHVILDMHQDNWGQVCDGNGAPAWATKWDQGVPVEELPAGSPWWIRAASPCVVQSVNNFFGNHQEFTNPDGSKVSIQGEYALAWKAVAERFKDTPAVLGYDLMNEPTLTDAIVDQMVHDMLSPTDTGLLNTAVHSRPLFEGLVRSKINDLASANNVQVPPSYIDEIVDTIFARSWGDWGQLKTVKYFENNFLTPFYQNVINSIRQVDSNASNDKYIFVEGFSLSVNNGEHTFLGHLDDPRGTGEDRRLGYIPHTYPRDLDINGVYKEGAFQNLIKWARNQHDYVSKNQMAWVTGEFGLSSSAEGSVHFLKDAILMMENYQLSWVYWDSTPGTWGDGAACVGETTCTITAPGVWGPIGADKRSDTPNTAALVNIYPRAVAGDIRYYHFDRDHNTFTLIYTNHEGASGTTDIAIPPRFAVNGFEVQSSDPTGAWSYSYDAERAILHITHDPYQPVHKFVIHQAGKQALSYVEFRNARNNKCLDFRGSFPVVGGDIIVWSCGADQTWQRWSYDSSSQQLRSLQDSSLCISHGDASNAIDGGKVSLATCADSDEQRWQRDDQGVFHNVLAPDFVLDANGDDDGANVSLWSSNGGLNQQWKVGSL